MIPCLKAKTSVKDQERMNMKNRWKAAAGALIIAFSAWILSPAQIFGEENETVEFEEYAGVPVFDLVKNVLVNHEYVPAPADDFTFTITPTAEGGPVTDGNRTIPVEAGPDNGVGWCRRDPLLDGSEHLIFPSEGLAVESQKPTIHFYNRKGTNEGQFDEEEYAWTKSQLMGVRESQFKNYPAGIYRYKVTEDTLDANSAIRYDLTEYYIDVYKMTDQKGKTEFSLAIYNSEDPGEKLKQLTFTNDMCNSVDEYGVHEVSINVLTKGNLANVDKTFDLEFFVDGDRPTEYFNYSLNDAEPVSFIGQDYLGDLSSHPTRISVKSGDNVTLYGISAHDKLYYRLTDPDSEGYSTKVEYQLPGHGRGYEDPIMAKSDSWLTMERFYYSPIIHFLNTRDAGSVTGLMIEYGPYALLLVMGGLIVAGVCLKKRKTEE